MESLYAHGLARGRDTKKQNWRYNSKKQNYRLEVCYARDGRMVVDGSSIDAQSNSMAWDKNRVAFSNDASRGIVDRVGLVGMI